MSAEITQLFEYGLGKMYGIRLLSSEYPSLIKLEMGVGGEGGEWADDSQLLWLADSFLGESDISRV